MRVVVYGSGRAFLASAVLAACGASSRAPLPADEAPDGGLLVVPWNDGFQQSAEDWDASKPGADASATLIEGPVRLFAFGSTTCALVPGNVLKCWGRNAYGLVGNRDVEERDVVDPTVVDGIAPTMVAGGADHVCASDGVTVWCWGKGEYGVLGTGVSQGGGADTFCKDGRACSLSPVPVEGLSSVRQIASGTDFSCAVMMDRTVRCWGRNDLGQLGTSPDAGGFDVCDGVACSTAPVLVPGISDVERISLGNTAACARTVTGEVSCWGRLFDVIYGTEQAGYNQYTSPTIAPSVLPDVRASTDVTLGFEHVCVVYGTSSVGCMGRNGSLEGNSSYVSVLRELTPRPLRESPFGFRRLALGAAHSCGLSNDNAAYCWGASFQAQIHDEHCDSPVGVAVLLPFVDVTDVSVGLEHTCVALANGEVHCRGRNDHGQLGGEIVGPFSCSDQGRIGHTSRQVTGLL